MEYVVFIGVVLSLVGTADYLINTIKGRTKPNRATWLVWGIAPLISTAAAVSDGATWAILPTFMVGFCPLLIFFASFINKKSYWRLGKSDYFCAALAILALVLWAIVKDPNVAILFSILADGLAAIPTLVKAWKHPETEAGMTYFLGIFAQITGFMAMKEWTFSESAFGIYMFLIDIVLTWVIYRKKFVKPRKSGKMSK